MGSHCSRVHRDNEWFRNPGSRRRHVIDPACPVWENCPTAGPEGTTRIMQLCTPASSSKSPKVWQTGGLDRSHFAKHNSKKKKIKKKEKKGVMIRPCCPTAQRNDPCHHPVVERSVGVRMRTRAPLRGPGKFVPCQTTSRIPGTPQPHGGSLICPTLHDPRKPSP
jgi:hypothetical protein